MNAGEHGYMPQFGPSWVNFYGAPRGFGFFDKKIHEDLNNGLGEGAAYRGRALISITSEIIDLEAEKKPPLIVDPIPPISEVRT